MVCDCLFTMTANTEALCEDGVFGNMSLHFSPMFDLFFALKNWLLRPTFTMRFFSRRAVEVFGNGPDLKVIFLTKTGCPKAFKPCTTTTLQMTGHFPLGRYISVISIFMVVFPIFLPESVNEPLTNAIPVGKVSVSCLPASRIYKAILPP